MGTALIGREREEVMFELLAMHVMIISTIITSVIGAFCILRRMRIFNLNISTRNLMYAGACCTMSFCFLGTAYCLGSLVMTTWHVVVAIVFTLVGMCATAHLSVDLGDRLRIQ